MRKNMYLVVMGLLLSISMPTTASAVENDGWPNVWIETGASGWLWKSSKGTTGYGAMLELPVWFADKSNAQNFGIGPIVAYSHGKTDTDFKFGATDVGLEGTYWKYIRIGGQKGSFLAKARGVHRWYKESDKSNGFVPGAYLELARVFSPRDLWSWYFDGWFVKDDTFAASRIQWERIISTTDPNWRMVFAPVGVVYHGLKDDSSVGFSPTLGVKYTFSPDTSLTVGVNAEFFSTGAPFIGGSISVNSGKLTILK